MNINESLYIWMCILVKLNIIEDIILQFLISKHWSNNFNIYEYMFKIDLYINIFF